MKTIILSVLILCGLLSNAQEDWKLIKDEDDIQVYKKSNEPYDLIKINAVVRTDLQTLANILNNAANYESWVYNCYDSQTILKKEYQLVYESKTDMPFPFYDRIIKINSTHELTDTKYSSVSQAMKCEDQKNLVAIQNFESTWVANYLEDGYIDIEYIVETEPGGYIPAWLYNMAVDIGPLSTMKNLKNLLERNSK